MKNKSNSDVNNENLKDVNEGITEEEAKDKEKELEEQAKEEENDQEIKDEDAAEEDEELQTRYLRLAADFQNYKKRIEKEKVIYSYANEKIITELLML